MEERGLFGRIALRATLEVKTGLHVGAAEGIMHVGGIDKQVVRDPMSQEPYIPGTSLRGKLRSLLERRHLGDAITADESIQYNRPIGGAPGNRRHECDDRSTALNCVVCRLFGSTGRAPQNRNHASRLFVRDAFLQPASAERLKRLPTPSFMTEWKFENTLDRVTAAANPRQLERVPRHARFDVELSYTVESKDPLAACDDIGRVFEALSLLEGDALGGHGSRGYGKVAFLDVTLTTQRYSTELTAFTMSDAFVVDTAQPTEAIHSAVAFLSRTPDE